MSVLGGLYSGISALGAQSRNFGIISDNIANVNTIGYKEVEGRFSNFVTSKSVARNFSPGGVTLRPFYDPQKQGLLQTSDSRTDISITGNGFFVVNKSEDAGSNDSFLFTRAGDFTPDKDGNLVNSAGYFLQGWALDSSGNIVNAASVDQLTSLQTVNVAGFSSVGQPTQNVSITANLPAGEDNTVAGPHQTTNMTVFDSLGAPQTLTFQWTKTANANEWTFETGITDSAGTFNAIAGATGTIQFDGDGSLDGPLATDAFTALGAAFGAPAADGTFQFTIPAASLATSGAEQPNDLVVNLNLGAPDGSSGLTQFSGDYELKLANQDGSAPSGLDQVIIDEEGLVTGVFANGQTRAIYQIATATFPAATRLDRDNGNAFTITSNSGDVVLNRPGVGAHGLLRPETLESSTADTAEEFADLIVAQRAYSAATRIVTTGDEMLDEAIRMKR